MAPAKLRVSAEKASFGEIDYCYRPSHSIIPSWLQSYAPRSLIGITSNHTST